MNKVYQGNIQPNPKKYKIWVDDKGVIKTYNGSEWIENSTQGGSGSDSSDGSQIYVIEDFVSLYYGQFITQDEFDALKNAIESGKFIMAKEGGGITTFVRYWVYEQTIYLYYISPYVGGFNLVELIIRPNLSIEFGQYMGFKPV